MKQVNIIIVSLLTFFLLATIGGCKESTKQTGGNECTETTNSPNMPFVITLSVANQAGIPTTTFTQGEPISFTITLTNASNSPQYVQVTNCITASSYPLNIEIIDKNDNDVWMFNPNPPTPCCSRGPYPSYPFPPPPILSGESITAPAILWDQKASDGNTVSAGAYSAKGFVLGVWQTTGTIFTTSTTFTCCTNVIPPSAPVNFIIK